MKTAQLITRFVNNSFSLMSEVRNNFNRQGFSDEISYRDSMHNALCEVRGICNTTLTNLESLEEEVNSDKLLADIAIGYNLVKERWHDINNDIESRFEANLQKPIFH